MKEFGLSAVRLIILAERRQSVRRGGFRHFRMGMSMLSEKFAKTHSIRDQYIKNQ
jgi:hypothetical protein